jgi:hypothetical protein
MPDIHFSVGFVVNPKPATPTICLDAVYVQEWRVDAAVWKRATDKCKPTS